MHINIPAVRLAIAPSMPVKCPEGFSRLHQQMTGQPAAGAFDLLPTQTQQSSFRSLQDQFELPD